MAKRFGSEGLAFTKMLLPEQAQAMASMLRVIESNDLESKIAALLATARGGARGDRERGPEEDGADEDDGASEAEDDEPEED